MQYRLPRVICRPLAAAQAFQPRCCCWLQVRKVAEENGVDVSTQIAELEMRAQQVLLLR